MKNGKGDTRRPQTISDDEMGERWEFIDWGRGMKGSTMEGPDGYGFRGGGGTRDGGKDNGST